MDEKEREEFLKEIEEYTEKIKEEPNNSNNHCKDLLLFS